jgi:hypothetical protein
MLSRDNSTSILALLRKDPRFRVHLWTKIAKKQGCVGTISSSATNVGGFGWVGQQAAQYMIKYASGGALCDSSQQEPGSDLFVLWPGPKDTLPRIFLLSWV